LRISTTTTSALAVTFKVIVAPAGAWSIALQMSDWTSVSNAANTSRTSG
jgi:hypothetical protein